MLLATWFFIWGLIWAIYFVLDGFDFGMGTILPFVAKNDRERRIIYNSSGPYWDGNEVWLITAGGVTFAAFPKAYAVMFSALYAPLLMLLFALIFRAVAFEFRNKIDDQRWRNACDVAVVLGNFLPALLLGVAFANLFMGIPIDGNGVYHGNILKLLNPYGLAGGILFVTMFAMHGSIWLGLKSSGEIHKRANCLANKLWIWLVVIIVAFLILTPVYTNLLHSYLTNPFLFVFPIIAVVALIAQRIFLNNDQMLAAWFTNAIVIMATTFTGVMAMFPSIIISSIDPAYSVTVYNGASTPLTLTIMLCVTLTSVPIVIAYQSWVYKVFAVKITDEDLDDGHSY